jgi:hypothetical protein
MELAPLRAQARTLRLLYRGLFQPLTSHILLKILSLSVTLYITFLIYFSGYIF